jgi:hypothetical protein
LRAGPFHPFDHFRDLFAPAVLDRPELRDRLAVAGDDDGLATLRCAQQTGQLGFGLVGADRVHFQPPF